MGEKLGGVGETNGHSYHEGAAQDRGEGSGGFGTCKKGRLRERDENTLGARGQNSIVYAGVWGKTRGVKEKFVGGPPLTCV